MEIFILLGLILINGLFVMSEIALVSARKARLESMADKGDELARRALELSYKPEVFLSAAQIGITLIAILTGVYSGERFSVYLVPFFKKISFLSDYAEGISLTSGSDSLTSSKETNFTLDGNIHIAGTYFD